MGNKLTIEFVREEFEKRGYTLLSDVYVNSKTKLDYICPNGHTHAITCNDLSSGYGCIYCAGKAKLTIEFVRASFEADGYTLLSTEYKNVKTKLECICSNGHSYSIKWKDWQQGKRCPKCNGGVRFDFEEVKQSFSDEGYILLSDCYTNAHAKLDYICDNGHRHSISYMCWKQSQRCPYCKKRPPIDLEYVKNSFNEYGYSVTSTTYTNSGGYIHYICDKGHHGKITWRNWYSGHRCSVCYYLSKFGEGNPAWNGGITFDKYCEVWKDKEYKNNIKERDTHKCLNPYCDSANPGDLNIHHINYDKKDCHPKNLITVCRSCNAKANFDRDWHQDWYQAILYRRYGYNY